VAGAAHVFIRAGVPSDADSFAAVHVAAWQVAYRGLIRPELLDRLSVADRAKSWHDQLSISHGDDYFAIVAESIDTGDVVGFATGGGTRDEERKGDGEIYALYVDPVAWRIGAGGALLGEALHRFRLASFEAGMLWTLENNLAARAFFEHDGWTTDDTTRPYAYEGTDLSEIRYLRALR
jgi:ribosomal protein S18 acetylase RimI-like enzyme